MSILRVANLQFNASGTRRIDYDSVADDGIINISAAAVKLPVGDTASRPTSQAGIVRYNSDTGYMEFGGATSWVPVASNAAFDVANAAYASANNVAPQVTPAFLTANLAYTTTNAAFAVANTALQNTSGVSFNGNFNVPNGSITVSGTPAQVNSSFIGITGASIGSAAYSASVNRPNTVSNIANYNAFGQFNQPLLNTNGFATSATGSYNIPIAASSSGTDRVLLYGSLNWALRNSNNDISTATNCAEYGAIFYAGHFNGLNNLSSYTSSIAGGLLASSYNYNGTITSMYGGWFNNFIGVSPNYTGSSTNLYSVYTAAQVGATSGTGTGTLTNYYDAYLAGVTVNATGTVTNRYGVYQAATNHINYFGGNVGIGTTSPSYKLHLANGSMGITSSTGAGQISITDDSDSGRGLLLKSNHSGTGNTYIGTNSSVKNLIFGIDSIERMRLDTSGNFNVIGNISGNFPSLFQSSTQATTSSDRSLGYSTSWTNHLSVTFTTTKAGPIYAGMVLAMTYESAAVQGEAQFVLSGAASMTSQFMAVAQQSDANRARGAHSMTWMFGNCPAGSYTLTLQVRNNGSGSTWILNNYLGFDTLYTSYM